MTTPRVNPLTVRCPYCEAAATRPCIQRGTRDPRNDYRGIRLRPGKYHDTRIQAAHALVMASAG